MKILIVFGSTSDERIYAPLAESLGKKHLVQMEVLSAHRDPDKLALLLQNATYDCICAGAGLAAHLPGVVASQVSKPVFGIPVDGCFGGLDAFLSIVQMPFGVPVLAMAPNKENLIGGFLDLLTQDLFSENIIEFIIDEKIRNYEYVTKELTRAEAFASSLGLEVKIVNQLTKKYPAVVYVNHDKEIVLEGPAIHIPILDDQAKMTPSKGAYFMDQASLGGHWCGVNNSRNAIKFWNQCQQMTNGSKNDK